MIEYLTSFRILIACFLALICLNRECLVIGDTEIESTSSKSESSEPERYFSYKPCVPEDDESGTPFVTVEKVDLQPDPVKINGDVHFWLDFSFANDLPMNSKLGVAIYRHMNMFGLNMKMKVPCIRNVGSCTYDVCDIANLMKEELCKRLPSDRSCQCPFKDGRYVINNGYIKVPQLSETFVNLAMGNYSGQVKVTTGDTTLGCAEFTLRLVRMT